MQSQLAFAELTVIAFARLAVTGDSLSPNLRNVYVVGVAGFEPAVFCSQSRRLQPG